MTFVPASELMVWDDGGNGKRGSGCHPRHAIETAPSSPWNWPVKLRAQATEPWDGTPQINPACFLAVPTGPRTGDEWHWCKLLDRQIDSASTVSTEWGEKVWRLPDKPEEATSKESPLLRQGIP
ncbi:hypothetical protein AlacWU_05269 [Aspergillus niger]|nr:hypothetical protein AlacWU_05269 [Aspergillus niger]